MKDITVIIPVHELDEQTTELLNNAIKSVGDNKAILIGPKSVISGIEVPSNVTKVNNEKETDFSSQINKAVDKVKTKYFLVLELDDVITSIWFKNVEEYEKEMSEDISIFLPLIEVYDFNTPGAPAIGYANEAVWASSFSNAIGFIDSECLMDYANFNLTGAVIRTDDFKEVGGLKTSIKLSFWYEFLLRLISKNKKAFVIPKIGYLHYVNRDGSLYDEYSKTMPEEEANWWMELAKKEYFFKTDRNKTYEG